MILHQTQDPDSKSYTYLLADPQSREAVLIDPVLTHVERDIARLEGLGLKLLFTLDTHVHADHITGAVVLRDRLGARTVTASADSAGSLVGRWRPPSRSSARARSALGSSIGCSAVCFEAAHERRNKWRALWRRLGHLPDDPGPRLLAGAALFGVGWGLAGFCPGPALISVLPGGRSALIFTVAMLGGMALFHVMERASQRRTAARQGS